MKPSVPFGDLVVVMPCCLLMRGRLNHVNARGRVDFLSDCSAQLLCSVSFVIFEGQLPGLLCKWLLSLLAW